MELSVHRAPARLDVGDVEDVRVRPAGEARADRVAHDRPGAVAPGDEPRPVLDPSPVRPGAARDARVALFDRPNRRPPLHPDPLRVTEVFRLEDGAYKLVHRHADLVDKADEAKRSDENARDPERR